MLLRNVRLQPGRGWSILTSVLKEIVSNLHDTASVLNDGNIRRLKHLERTILKAVDGLQISQC
jgi:hypothetical protein